MRDIDNVKVELHFAWRDAFDAGNYALSLLLAKVQDWAEIIEAELNDAHRREEDLREKLGEGPRSTNPRPPTLGSPRSVSLRSRSPS